jgi:hypothetical protein
MNTKARLASLFATLRSQGWEPGQVAGWEGETLEKNYCILCEAGTTAKLLPLSCVAVELLAAHQSDTVRGNMYLVVSAGFLPDTSNKSYDRIQRLLNRLRENGTIPFEWVVDNVRQTIKPSSWSGLQDYAEAVRDAYRMDYWRIDGGELMRLLVAIDCLMRRHALVFQGQADDDSGTELSAGGNQR